jgi:O-antigen ligase
VQLVPLPPALWQVLPGRAGATAALAGEGGWRPWSLVPDDTLAAALALVPATVMTVLVAALDPPARVRLLAVLVAIGAAAALLGLVQFMAGADRPLSFYAAVHHGWGIGFFANRNAQADLLAIALGGGVLLAERYRERLRSAAAQVAVVGGLLLILAGGVVTGSRMGLAMLTLPVLLGLAVAQRHASLLALAGAATAGLMLVGGTTLDQVVARAGDPGNRVAIWSDAITVARTHAPVGAGMGSFATVFPAAERLEHVEPTIANRAHNDWLELAIEGGVPALLLVAAALAFVARRAARGWRDPDPDRRLLARFAGLTAAVLALHSTVDYPLRTLTLLTVAALALAGLASARAPQQS